MTWGDGGTLAPNYRYGTGALRRKFYLPHEHGAWWTLLTCMVSGDLVALRHHAAWPYLLMATQGSLGVFMASDWLWSLAGALSGRGRPGRSDWRAWQGWLLAGVSALSLLTLFDFLGSAAWWGLFALLAALGGAVLGMRLFLPLRHSFLLAFSSLLLTFPALLAAAMAGQTGAALRFWLRPAIYFPAGVFFVQTWLRGGTVSWRRLAWASLPYAALLGLVAMGKDYLAVAATFLYWARTMARVLARRRQARQSLAQPPAAGARMLPPLSEIKKFGWEQVAWSLVLMTIWVAEFWGPAPRL